MYSICCTSKVLQRTHFPIEPQPPEPTTTLGNWYVNLIFIEHQQYLLFTSDVSRLAVVTPAKEMRSLARHLTFHLSNLLVELGIRPEIIDREIDEMSNVCYSTTHSRSILGTMSDFKFQMEANFYYSGSIDLLDIAYRLSTTPIGQKEYFFPYELTCELLLKRYGKS